MALEEQFQEAVKKSRQLPDQSNDNLLKIYSLYKQATEGDINTERPSNPFDIAGMAKYNAWDEKKGMSKEEAMEQYVALIEALGSEG